MAILDFLVPDLAPEQYSSGQGTGYAQQYNLGAPNPFDVAQQYADKAVQTKKLQLEKDLLNEKNRQEAFSKYITDIKYDPKWVIAESNFEQEVDDIGNFISEWRASGKPVNTEFQIELNKKKAKLNSLKGMNEETFTRYNKNIEKMLEGLGKDYEKEDIAKYENEIKKAYEQGGIEAGFNKVNQIRPLKEFDISKHFLADFPKPESSADGRTSDQVKEEMDDHTNNKWMAMTQDRQQQVIDDLYYANKIKEKTPDEAINYIRNNVVDLYNQRRVGEDKTKPIEINQHFSKYYPKPEYLDALNSDQVKEELDLYNENRWFDLGDKKQEIIDRLFKDGLIETATLADAKKYTRNIVDLYNNPVKRQGRAATKSADEKVAEKTFLEPFKEYPTTGYKDGYSISIPKSAEFINENGESIYIKPNRVLPVSGKGVVLEGKRLVQGGDKGYFETEESAKNAFDVWKKQNPGKTAKVEQDPETKKFIIVTGDKETIRIGKGKNADENLATFKANFGKDLVEEFEKLGVENDKVEKKPSGTWMKTQFYGQVDYSNK